MNFNATFIGQIIVFAIFVALCAKYVWPPIMAVMQERQKKIADGLDAASKADKALELAQDDAAEQIRVAKQQAADMLEQANRRAASIVDDAKSEADSQAKRIIAAAQAEVDKERQLARESLRARVAELAVTGAEKILEAEVDRAKHAQYLEKLAAEL